MKNILTSNKNEFYFVLALLLISILFWNTYLIYPIKMFSVLIHETFHGFGALISGGKINSVNIDFNLGGKIETEFGNEFLIAISGYFGSLLIGILFFIYSRNNNWLKYLSYLISIIIVIVISNSNPSFEFISISLIVIFFLIFLSIFNTNFYIQLFARFFGLVSMFYVLIDLKNDLFDEFYVSDSKILANIIDVNSSLIGLIWLIISFLLIYFSIKKNYFKNY
ncbi:MAG: M50 family metallopeptidase [Melioribacteraceae bacterium]|nr:M50 family metallopeptidase [Melioribacteraceae bacterium]